MKKVFLLIALLLFGFYLQKQSEKVSIKQKYKTETSEVK